MRLFAEVLDRQLVDRDDCELGRVDGIVAELRDGDQPRIIRLEVGFVSLAHRVGRRFERLADAVHKRLGVRRGARYGIPWSKVLDVDAHCIKVDVKAEETPPYDWELWLRKHVVEKIPGSSSDR